MGKFILLHEMLFHSKSVFLYNVIIVLALIKKLKKNNEYGTIQFLNYPYLNLSIVLYI